MMALWSLFFFFNLDSKGIKRVTCFTISQNGAGGNFSHDLFSKKLFYVGQQKKKIKNLTLIFEHHGIWQNF